MTTDSNGNVYKGKQAETVSGSLKNPKSNMQPKPNKAAVLLTLALMAALMTAGQVSAINIDSCQSLANVSGTVYTLTQNVIADSTTCFTFNNNSLTLDCQGNTVQVSSNTNTGRGVLIDTKNHTLIQGCRFLGNGTIRNTRAIEFNLPLNMTIRNNTFTTENGSFSTELRGTSQIEGFDANSTITGNFFFSTLSTSISSVAIDIAAFGLNNMTIQGNNITTAASTAAIRLFSNGGNINNYTVVDNNNITYYGGRGIQITGARHYGHIISRNNITGNGTGNAIDAEGTGLTVRGNYINVTSTDAGIAVNTVTGGSGDVLIEQNRVLSSGASISVALTSSSSGNFTIFNNTLTSSSTGGMSLTGSGSVGLKNSTITNNTIRTSGAATYGIYITAAAKNNSIINNTIVNTGSSAIGLHFAGGDIENNTVYNNFFNTTAAAITVTSTGDFTNFSITSIAGSNIVGGTNIGGNFYANSTAGGEKSYSMFCRDENENGFCDFPLIFVARTFADFFSLSYVQRSDTPTLFNNGSNVTSPRIHDVIRLSVNGTDNNGLVVNQTVVRNITVEHNFTGIGFLNQTVHINLSSGNASFNMSTNQSQGKVIAFRFFVDDGAGNANTTALKLLTVANTAPVTISPTINNSPIGGGESSNVSWNQGDVDNDTISSFEIRWFINGQLNTTGNDQRLMLSGNYTTDDTVVAMVRVNDGTDWSAQVNTTTVVVGDSTAPLILDNFTNPVSVEVQNPINVFVNVTDANSAIDTVTFVVTNTNQQSNSLAGSVDEGTNTAGNVTRWSIAYTPTVSGNHQVNVTVTDASGNTARSVQGFLNFTATAASSSSSSGGGGGGGPAQIETVVVKESFVGCGDDVCSAGENPAQCFQDCPVNVDNLVLCLFKGNECAYDQAWFAQALILFLIGGGGFIFITSQNKVAKARVRS